MMKKSIQQKYAQFVSALYFNLNVQPEIQILFGLDSNSNMSLSHKKEGWIMLMDLNFSDADANSFFGRSLVI